MGRVRVWLDINDSNRQSHLAGNGNLCTQSYPADGTATNSADVGDTTSSLHLASQWFSDLSGWLIPPYAKSQLKVYGPGGNVTTLVTLPRAILSATVIKNASNQNIVYYCSTTNRIYKYNIATSTETQLAWPGTSYSCTGVTIKYQSSRGSVVFPYTKDGLTGFAEIVNTP